jgi:hypothetical protein
MTRTPTMFYGLEISPEKHNRLVEILSLQGVGGLVYYQVSIALYKMEGTYRPKEHFVFRNRKAAFKYAAEYLEA